MMETTFFVSRETVIPRLNRWLFSNWRAAVRLHVQERDQPDRLLPYPQQPGGRTRHAVGDLTRPRAIRAAGRRPGFGVTFRPKHRRRRRVAAPPERRNPWFRTSPPAYRPLLELERQFLDNACDIEKVVPVPSGGTTCRLSTVPPTCATRAWLAPVDLNLFPGGFNNLNVFAAIACRRRRRRSTHLPGRQQAAVDPENTPATSSTCRTSLASILRLTGLDVRIGSLLPEIAAPTVLELANGATLTLEPLRAAATASGLDDRPCAGAAQQRPVCGHSAGAQGPRRAVVDPALHAGWHKRRKSKHAECYDRVAREFAAAISIDPWRINPEFGVCGQINFQERTGECLAAQVNSLLTRIAPSTKEYGVTDEPSWWSRPTPAPRHGRDDGEGRLEVVGLNRRQRNKMAVVKENLQVPEVIIQEAYTPSRRWRTASPSRSWT